MTRISHPGAVVHHSASAQTKTPEAIRRDHMAPKPHGRGWADIGYHFVLYLTDEGWEVAHGRPLGRKGAHDFGANDLVGVCVCGDYTREELPAEARDKLVALLADLAQVYHFGAGDIYGHRERAPGEHDADATDCPGFEMPPIRAAVEIELEHRERAKVASRGVAVLEPHVSEVTA